MVHSYLQLSQKFAILIYASILLIAQQVLSNSMTNHHTHHLVVLSHGIMGTSFDLSFLSGQLRSSGCVVLESKANERLNSLAGIDACANRLIEEIQLFIAEATESRNITHISFVGNSLGGLYARQAVKLIFERRADTETNTILGLLPYKFLTIASPHLGVFNFTFLDENGFPVPAFLKALVGKLFGPSGNDLFDVPQENSLLYRMATNETWLAPLRFFRKRRLYANVNRDFVVPLGTAAFINRDMVTRLRKKYKDKFGIVEIIESSSTCDEGNNTENASPLDVMIRGLDSLNFEKVLVNFQGVVPIAHNKICALTRHPSWFYHGVLGFQEGQFVMKDAANWLIRDEDY